MGTSADRRAEQEARERDDERAMNERQNAGPIVRHVPSGWASTCAGWRVGIHERTKGDRLAGIYKCKWCARAFDPPTADELEIMRQRALSYQRPQHVSTRRGR